MTAWRSFLTVAALAAVASDAIRVYEGTNLGRPVQSSTTNSSWHRRGEPLQEAQTRADDVRIAIADDQLKFSKELKTTPELYKVKLTQKGYLQFLRYLTDVPPLREYTFCLWFASNDLSHRQTLFSYALHDKEQLVTFWYEPTDATLRMSIRGDLAVKVPTRFREGVWYHVCQSWNGVYGEWSVYLDGGRIGSGKLHKYKGTYIPGGGEVVVGQEPTDFHRGSDAGIEGEVFGFNMVDECIKDDAVTVKPRHPPKQLPADSIEHNSLAPLPPTKPDQQSPYIPPFKSLPPMKKSYQEIKAFITSLPSKPAEYGARTRPILPPSRAMPKPVRKGKPSPPLPPPPKDRQRPARNKQRIRYKPAIRKMVIYDRDGRQMRFNDSEAVNRIGEVPPVSAPTIAENQISDGNRSIHSYREPRDRKRVSKYEIYEVFEDEDVRKGFGEQEDPAGQRKVRHSFDIYTARQANSLYARANKLRQHHPPTYHYQRNKGKAQISSRRSDTVQPKPGANFLRPKTPLDFIPVYEAIDEDVPLFRRRKRDVRAVDELTASFQPMPDIPDGFIKMFAESKTRDEMDQKLNYFFPNRTSDFAAEPHTSVPEKVSAEPGKGTLQNDVDESVASRRNMIVDLTELENRKALTSGSELVARTYRECEADRGSPVRDRGRLIVSWAETPVRIYGGAAVTAANQICGHF